MKILIVNTTDIQGGAARASYRLHKSLLSQNIDSQLLVQSKSSDDFTVITQEKKITKYFNKLRPLIDSIPVRFYRERTKTLFSPSWVGFSSVVDKINEIKPDIVHLHWICEGMITIEDLARIKAPIVWSLHDMWPFTGGCHYDEECALFEKLCVSCKVLGCNKENDLSRRVFRRKQKTFSKIKNMTIVGLSRWLSKCAKNSTLLKDKKHINLPNPIDTATFSPLEKQLAKKIFNLPQDKHLVLFGAMGATSDPRKGFKQLCDALSNVDAENTELVVFGSGEPEMPQGFKQKNHYLGHLHDDVSLRVLYSAADVMVVPSLQENLSNAIMESLACGTPVVGFDIGGNRDLVNHLSNGYLAKPFNTDDLAVGIETILNAENYVELCQNARNIVLQEFDSVVVAKRYIRLYQDVLSARESC